MKQILTITRKELKGYFGSPMAIIFIGTFLAVTLFSFFWMDAFFARGIADVRPLFRRMPVLMIFLVAALTMRQWSEEQRAGTLEILLTLPVSTIQLVIGKFLAVVALVAISLALTLGLPLTVSVLGNLDWGPVFGGYLAAILMAGAYAAIGLFASSRTDNQIVALISTALLGGLFYLVGSSGVTDFVGRGMAEALRAIGVGSRFESIERGVIDIRDLLYYLTLTGLFLTLNVLSLKAKGWSTGEQTWPRRRGVAVTSALLALNLIFVNVWAFPLRGLRLDLTQNKRYTLSKTTRELLSALQEPLLIRGYFSEETHPYLAPLVPQITDMLEEYRVASGGRVRLEIIDPAEHPEKEAEANQVYGIRSKPFQVTDRRQSSVINSYFDILIQYGDQSEVLSFDQLIEIEPQRDGGIDVRLRNLEYDLTSTIQKAVYGFQSIENVLASLPAPVEMTVYITPDMLPEWMAEAPTTVKAVAEEIASQSGGKFSYQTIDPTASDSPVSPQTLYEEYNIQPIATSLFSDESYYFYMVLETEDKEKEPQVVYPSGELSEAEIRTSIESTLKRWSSGFLQVVGLWTPPETPTQDMMGQQQPPFSTWQVTAQALQQEYEVRRVDLSSGVVPSDIDVLVVIAPQAFTEREYYTIDQYMMRGGAVVLAAGSYKIAPDQMTGSIMGQYIPDGVEDLTAHYGVTVTNQMILDPQNEPFPIPQTRNVGGVQVQEFATIDYPFFVDVRPNQMAEGHPIVSNLNAVTLNWASPLKIDEAQNEHRELTVLLESTDEAWTQGLSNIQPNFDMYEAYGFEVNEATRGSYPLAVAVRGAFESYFADKASPFAADAAPSAETEEGAPQPQQNVPGVIELSPETSRLVVIGSGEFLNDIVFEISSTLSRDRYLNSLKLLQNAVSWATEDLDLLEIRARGTTTRVLVPLTDQQQSFWEIVNYVLALVALIALGVVGVLRRRNAAPMELVSQEELAARGVS